MPIVVIGAREKYGLDTLAAIDTIAKSSPE